jgi:biopolymer transport protein ExbD
MRFRDFSKPDSRVDITPLVDVVFLLLIFFMISTTFISSPGIKVRLPKGSSQEIKEEKNQIDVVITSEGRTFLEGEEFDENALSRTFRAAYERDQDTSIILRADREVAHGKVVRVMDLARRAQLYRIAIATEVPPK